MKITIIDNMVEVITPSEYKFVITIKPDSIDVLGERPIREIESQNILSIRTIDPNKVKISI